MRARTRERHVIAWTAAVNKALNANFVGQGAPMEMKAAMTRAMGPKGFFCLVREG